MKQNEASIPNSVSVQYTISDHTIYDCYYYGASHPIRALTMTMVTATMVSVATMTNKTITITIELIWCTFWKFVTFVFSLNGKIRINRFVCSILRSLFKQNKKKIDEISKESIIGSINNMKYLDMCVRFEARIKAWMVLKPNRIQMSRMKRIEYGIIYMHAQTVANFYLLSLCQVSQQYTCTVQRRYIWSSVCK